MNNRLFLVSEKKIGDLCMQLQNHGMFLDGFDTTYIVSNEIDKIKELLKITNVDTTKFEFLSDQFFYSTIPNISQFLDLHPFMGRWLVQQIIKLYVLDTFDFKTMSIHDPDTFWIKPWNHFHNGRPILQSWSNNTQPPAMKEKALQLAGIVSQHDKSLITEFMCVEKQDWVSLRHRIEKISGKNWIDSIADVLHMDEYGWVWFSEYELLGNWIIYIRNPKIEDQCRLEIDSLDELNSLESICSIANLGDRNKKTNILFETKKHNNQWQINNWDRWLDLFPQYRPQRV